MSQKPPNLPSSFSLAKVKPEDPLKTLADNFSNLNVSANSQTAAQSPLTLIAMMQEHHKNAPPKNTPPGNPFFKGYVAK